MESGMEVTDWLKKVYWIQRDTHGKDQRIQRLKLCVHNNQWWAYE